MLNIRPRNPVVVNLKEKKNINSPETTSFTSLGFLHLKRKAIIDPNEWYFCKIWFVTSRQTPFCRAQACERKCVKCFYFTSKFSTCTSIWRSARVTAASVALTQANHRSSHEIRRVGISSPYLRCPYQHFFHHVLMEECLSCKVTSL